METLTTNNLSVRCLNEDPYSGKIANFITSVTGKAFITDQKEILNLMEDAIYADSHIRFGPRPELEDRVYLRSILTNYMEEKRPIPILVPWGSIKTKFGENIDIAEYMAIKQIVHLKERVKELYTPGVEIVLRIEDTSGYELFKLEADENTIFSGTQLYSNNLSKLIDILDNKESIWAIKESDMKESNHFSFVCEHLVPLFEEYLYDTDSSSSWNDNEFLALRSFKALKEQGWSGLIPKLQRDHYYRAYEKLYNGDKELMRKRLAMYFAGSLTRHKLNMTGKQEQWNYGFIQLAFVPPIPGIPNGYNKNYVYYRTMPENFTRLHMPPWRSKGFLSISDNGTLSIKPKLANWYDHKDFNPLELNVESDKGHVVIKADYILV